MSLSLLAGNSSRDLRHGPASTPASAFDVLSLVAPPRRPAFRQPEFLRASAASPRVAGNKTVFRGGKRMNRIASAVVAATVLLAASIAPAAAEVVRLEITDKTPYGTFPPCAYVLGRGKVHGELSPTEAIPDLDKARRNEAGKVEYSSEVMLLMPADPS